MKCDEYIMTTKERKTQNINFCIRKKQEIDKSPEADFYRNKTTWQDGRRASNLYLH